MSSADNLCKQFGHIWDLTKEHAWSESKLFASLMVFLKDFFFLKLFWKTKCAKLPSMQSTAAHWVCIGCLKRKCKVIKLMLQIVKLHKHNMICTQSKKGCLPTKKNAQIFFYHQFTSSFAWILFFRILLLWAPTLNAKAVKILSGTKPAEMEALPKNSLVLYGWQ